jgi:hypothetical protein
MGAGLGCCAQNGAIDDNADVAAFDARNRNHAAPKSSRFFPAKSKSKRKAKSIVVGILQGPNNKNENENNSNNRDGSVSGAFRYEDEEGSDLFFSAKQSLSLFVGELPESLLQSSGESSPLRQQEQQLCANENNNNNNDNDNDNNGNGNGNAMGKIDEEEESSKSSAFLTERLTTDVTIEAGYPGELSKDELEACLEFRRRLKEHRDPTYSVMVYLNVDIDVEGGENENDNNEFAKDGRGTQESTRTAKISNVSGRGPEEEAFALCRFLRARQFDVDKTFAMMDEHIDMFKEALTKHGLHRSKTAIEDHIGCPLPVFLNQFPMLDYGLAKNGAFVVYMKAGWIRLQDGFDCINTASTPKTFVERYMPMSWYIICQVFCETMHRLQKERRSTKAGDDDDDGNADDFVLLAETVLIVDLEGLKRELFTKRTMEFLQQALGVIQCFPEILNRVMVINVPYFFTFIWAVLKHFIDARTVRKVGFFSSLASAQKELLESVDSSQVLVDYGGETGNPTYEEALVLKQKRDGEYDRYVFVRYSAKTTKMPKKAPNASVTLQTFTLNETEEAELTVYTQAKLDNDTGDGESKSGTKFLLLPESSFPPAANVSRNIKNANSNRNSSNTTGHPLRFGQPAATTDEHCRVLGPGTFRLVVKKSSAGPIIDKALLVVSIR